MGRTAIDLTGQTFGRWYVLGKDLIRTRKGGPTYWLCKCLCGNPEVRSVQLGHLRSGKSKSCGKCFQYEIIGKQFGRLTVLEIDLDYKKEYNIKSSNTFVKVQCNCENKTVFTINSRSLIDGSSQSCGCLQKELLAKRATTNLKGQIINNFEAIQALNERKNNHIVWLCKCLKCGRTRKISTHHFNRKDCPLCICQKEISKGELEIINLLEQNDIEFEKEKTFNDLVNPNTNRKLRYDFYLPKYNRLIEFDGEQHYNSESFSWHKNYDFEIVQQNDKIKNNYALQNKIDLIRIPYWERGKITLEFLLENKYLVGKGDIIYE